MSRAGRFLAFVCGATLVALRAPAASAAATCTVLDYSFQPDCFRAPTDTGCVFDPTHPDMGPQIAVWLESADGTQFIDTLMVTNAVAIHGIGNRPGTWDLLSGPRFPYGRRPQALPIWAHARGELYQFVAMNDGMEDELAYHENTSSPEPYFCRPMTLSEVVDAVTCPSGTFRSAKGLLDPTQPASYYPPRADLFDFGGTPCFPKIGSPGSCDPGDSAQYFTMNDVDVVAAATPPYGSPFTGSWVIPADLPAGDYRLAVEVGKEFDTNAANQHPNEVSTLDMQNYPYDGQKNNVGQPSVLFRLPFSYGPNAAGTTASATDIAGYGDWTGVTGAVNPPDATISSDPGSGAGRLLPLAGASGAARVTLALGPCPTIDCGATPSPIPLPVSFTATPSPNGTGVTLAVLQSSQNNGQPVVGYETRYTFVGPLQPIDPTTFPAWTPAGAIPVGAPDSSTSVQIDGLTPLTDYAVGVSAVGICGDSQVTFQHFQTPAIPYAKLTGCFIATAAFGSDLDPTVATLRAMRDAATARSVVARTAVDLYYRSSPPLASLLTRSPTARALVRTAIRAFTTP